VALPREKSDWSPYLGDILEFYRELITVIARYEKVIVVCADEKKARELLGASAREAVFVEALTNDTWARDFGFITAEEDGEAVLLDYTFNGWGAKFAADLDDQVNSRLIAAGLFSGAKYEKKSLILEGGSVESDGAGTIMTTATCLFAPNRNFGLTREDFEREFAADFGAKRGRVLWLENGRLENDDTDAHIDTLARFASPETIMYVGCADASDPHYEPLANMKDELMAFRTAAGKPYNLVELPMAEPIYFNGERLPATYANFLFVNGAVLAPTYGEPICGSRADKEALNIFRETFPNREIVPIDCRVPIRQHGSLHCLTMQFPSIISRAGKAVATY
jgi:agmatine/peptidylarginine deiminase